MLHQTITQTPKETRISMRVDLQRKEVISRAARLRHTTISNFVLDNAYLAAAEILENETRVQLSSEDYKYFCRVLDNPPPSNLVNMKKLLNRKTPLGK